MSVRGLRGATTVAKNDKNEIISATKELLAGLLTANNLQVPDIASVVFTVTPDLLAEFPAVAAREIGWADTPLLCATEIDVPGSLPRCIRVLLHVNSEQPQAEMKHLYLKEAQSLRR